MSESYSQRDDVRTTTLALIGLIAVILVFAVIILLMVVYYHTAQRERYEKHLSQAPAELSNLVADQQARLAEYRWIDQKKGVVAVPIDRAMEIVVAELASPAPPVQKPEAKREKEKSDAR